MASFLEAISLEGDALAARWRRLDRCDLYAETRTLTLRVVLRVTFGLEPDEADAELSDTISQYLEAIVATANEVPPLYQLYPPLSKNYVRVTEELLPRLRRLVKELIEQRRRDSTKDAPDLLSQLLRDGTLSDDDILYILFDLVIAGSDTTASTVAASLYILHEPRHSKLLQRAVDEALHTGVRADCYAALDLILHFLDLRGHLWSEEAVSSKGPRVGCMACRNLEETNRLGHVRWRRLTR